MHKSKLTALIAKELRKLSERGDRKKQIKIFAVRAHTGPRAQRQWSLKQRTSLPKLLRRR